MKRLAEVEGHSRIKIRKRIAVAQDSSGDETEQAAGEY